MFRFENIEFLYFLLLIPAFFILFNISTVVGRKRMKRFGDIKVLNVLMPDVSKSRPTIKLILYVFALAFIILAIARPQYGTRLQEIKRKGIEIIIAMDVSNSMMAEDIQPNRLEKAKQAVS
ncbi:MAG: BatA domain-containing protein, partial [Bacteroidota bacterium]|nr:BatA domain-containing protein [Bacteroidota bacterium]